MKEYKITEIFYSIQGEGFHVGMPAVFVRFATCNLKCSFCDTDFTNKQEMTKEEIKEEVYKQNKFVKNIVFTGGEPLLQLDGDLIHEFTDVNIFIETNGTQPLPEIKNIWITCSPKPPLYKILLSDYNELKIVWNKDFDTLILDRFNFQNGLKYLQPDNNGKEEIDQITEFLKTNNDWRMSLQCHKLIGLK